MINKSSILSVSNINVSKNNGISELNSKNNKNLNISKNSDIINFSQQSTYNTPSQKLENEKVVSLLNNKLSLITLNDNYKHNSYKLKKSNLNHSSVVHCPPANKE